MDPRRKVSGVDWILQAREYAYCFAGGFDIKDDGRVYGSFIFNATDLPNRSIVVFLEFT